MTEVFKVKEPLSDRALAYKRNCLVISLIVLGSVLLPGDIDIGALKFFGIEPKARAVWIALLVIHFYFFIMFLSLAVPQFRFWREETRLLVPYRWFLDKWLLKPGQMFPGPGRRTGGKLPPYKAENMYDFAAPKKDLEDDPNIVRIDLDDPDTYEPINYAIRVYQRTSLMDFALPIGTSLVSFLVTFYSIYKA